MKTTTNNTNTTSNNKPVHKIRLGSVSAAIWENAFDADRTTHRAILVKSYRDAQGNWQETGSFRIEDLLLVSRVAQLAVDWMLARENES
jgi:hypothetical protein